MPLILIVRGNIEAAKAMDFQAFYNMFQNVGLVINVKASMMS